MEPYRRGAVAVLIVGTWLVSVAVQGRAQSASPSPAASADAQEGAQLGLAERRAVKQYQDEKYPDLLKAIRAAAGFDVEVEVMWNQIALPGEADRYSEDGYWTQIYFQPLIEALKRVARDDMGKAAVKKGLKKILIRHDEKTAPASNYPEGLAFQDGVLSINWTPNSNSGDGAERAKALVGALEPRL